MQDLSGIWSLSDESGQIKAEFALPGDGVDALHKAGKISDPYWGRNEYDLRWIGERDWTATRQFDHAGTASELVIEELDCVAEIWLNGSQVLAAENMFRRYRINVSTTLRAGKNNIEIRFKSPVREGAARQAAQPFFLPWSDANSPIPNGNLLRKQQCDFGWDWNIALATFGLYGAIRLEPIGPRVGDIIVKQTHSGGKATVDLTVQVVNTTAPVTATLCGVTATAQPDATGKAHLQLVIDKPDLWWPAGLGPQTLHDLIVTCDGASAHRKIGLRDLQLVSEPDAAGRSFGFKVNGHPVFARGANWIPADALAGRITPEAVRDLLQSAVDANMNMIRVWGGGRYEPDWFYDLCSELGLMVWQDFMFSCNIYPSTPDYLAEVDAEVRDVVARMNHHACIAVWCGDNELIGAISWYEVTRKDRDRYLVNYDRLNRTIETAMLSVLPHANWWPSSPSPGPMNFGDAWHDDSSGDMHFWSVWHEGRDFDHYRDVKPRFCSEFGFQSYPSMNTIRRFADEKDWNIAAPVMESHQKNKGGNARIAETMFRYFRFPVDFPNFVYLSQVQQGLAIKTAVTQWRSLKPHCMGALYWQLNDTWPVCSWASLDHGGDWKLMHHMAKAFFAPITVSAVPLGDNIELRAVNDTLTAVDLVVSAVAVAMDGTTRAINKAQVTVAPDAAKLALTVPKSALGPQDMLAFTWTDAAGNRLGGDHFAPLPYKAYDLQDAGLSHTITPGPVWTITIAAEKLALFVAVEADCDGRFSQNAMALFPGHPATITFTPKDPKAQPQFTLRDLHSATYGKNT
ncbi:beta-mannosidase [Neogemmobacter tilapiae]|uniref:beta-mannosidase n=1 Tax=Neogemmobacter tilapiae TaxID=875041 RepID=A0A918TTY2_9RHOB|nr:glycoside hydrolase family 2 protein [Gemmobacter tilapiae]GHC61057.1 beta-mannosidase [Gemmobacter tilapiae]